MGKCEWLGPQLAVLVRMDASLEQGMKSHVGKEASLRHPKWLLPMQHHTCAKSLLLLPLWPFPRCLRLCFSATTLATDCSCTVPHAMVQQSASRGCPRGYRDLREWEMAVKSQRLRRRSRPAPCKSQKAVPVDRNRNQSFLSC